VVGISLLTLVPGAVGGSETYAGALTRGLAEHGELDYLAFVPPVAPDAGDGLPAETVSEYRAARSLPGRFAAMALAGLRPRRIRARLDRADAVHYPLTIALPESRRPFAVTLHDVLHLDRPELFPRWERSLRTVAYDRSARRARAVIVPSAFVRDRALELLGLDPTRVHVAPHGIDHDLFHPGAERREPFVVYPARRWPHKNHERLLEAFALVQRERPGLELVLTGAGHDGRRLPPGVSVRGHVPLEELAALYRRASALVFPSLYEGFGQPPLEAMACGCPVAVSRIPPLEEVCAEAATYFDATDPAAIAAGVLDALAGGSVRAGIERASAFTWAASAHSHDTAYRTLLDQSV
jgi:glycosyltransferase involved in cell wall biosynthesis